MNGSRPCETVPTAVPELKLLFLAIAQIVILLATLPVACLAWTEPDESDGKPMEEIGAGESAMMGR
jgi:hypothetical protein